MREVHLPTEIWRRMDFERANISIAREKEAREEETREERVRHGWPRELAHGIEATRKSRGKETSRPAQREICSFPPPWNRRRNGVVHASRFLRVFFSLLVNLIVTSYFCLDSTLINSIDNTPSIPQYVSSYGKKNFPERMSLGEKSQRALYLILRKKKKQKNITLSSPPLTHKTDLGAAATSRLPSLQIPSISMTTGSRQKPRAVPAVGEEE